MNHAATVTACSLIGAALSMFLGTACTKNTTPEEKTQPRQTSPAAKEDRSAAASRPAKASAGTLYAHTEGGATTTVAVTPEDGAIAYTLSIKSDRSECSARLEGVAKEKEGDMESRDDAQGGGHFVTEYIEEGETCGVSVSIDLETKKMAWVEVWDCKAIADGCPGPLKGPLTVQQAGTAP